MAAPANKTINDLNGKWVMVSAVLSLSLVSSLLVKEP